MSRRDRKKKSKQAFGGLGGIEGMGGITGIPEGAQGVVSGLPQAFQDALAQAPPEVLSQLEGFEQAPVVDQAGIESALAGGAVDPQKLLDALPGGIADQVDLDSLQVKEGQTLSFTSTQVTGPKQKLEVRFARDAYRPGDTVEGVIVARERVKARELIVELGYVEQSPDYAEHAVHDTDETRHTGHLEPGTEVPFALTIPAGALPNWDPAGAARMRAAGTVSTGAPTSGRLDLASYGQLFWGVVVTATRRGMVGHDVEHHPIPVVDDPVAWPGPAPGEAEEIEAVKGWDVDVQVAPRAPRRGEEVVVDLSIGEPAAGRDGLAVGLVGELHYDLETTSHNNDGPDSTHRTTRVADVHEEWLTLDGAQPLQQVRFRVPEDAPFSYGRGKGKKLGKSGKMTFTKMSGSRGDGIALAVEWKLIVREDKKMRRDPRRVARLQVLP